MPHVLFLSHDSQLISTMQAACAKLAMDMSVCPDVKHAASMLKRKKFYAALVDNAEGAITSDFLAAVRASTSSKTAISIVFAEPPARGVPDAAVVVAKPVSPELALRTLRAAKGSMAKELHRYLRHPIKTAVTLSLPSKREVHATSVNISDGGLEIQLIEPEAFPTEGPVLARFVLPETGAWVQVNGQVIWCDGNRVGLRYRPITPNDDERLRIWLSSHSVPFVH